jgi:hypothetical protein
MPGGHDASLPSSAPKNLAAGQKYTLKSPNVDAENIAHSTIRLVSTPGAIAAFDDDENKTEECRKFPVGTHVAVIDKQNISTVSITQKFKLKEEGECNGTIGRVDHRLTFKNNPKRCKSRLTIRTNSFMIYG